ncbi:unnamed protein product [Rotaria socialis]|uniref:Uncharacterized protein n=1 Tax=Rotaria socialis TaxID=392032 RepID=A0A820SGB8_9BILA|nr:unnamed protein product [Rotaria socialis]CAF3477899.1 unnamed protein product [Rotaria socialis]CAF4348631.1 unnamed protein product [Rotaria socialis]CAF4452680.1 unnamed protein product [Rotaria socialis]
MDIHGNRKNIGHIMLILVDVLNLAEQIGVYFIARENDLDETEQQKFFFILFAVGGALVFKPLCVHAIPMVLFSIAIEIGELVSYLAVLSNTTTLLVVVIVFSAVEIMLHMISIIGLWGENNGYCEEFVKNCCALPVRVILYGLLFQTQILFLFLDVNSPFRGTYYEVLMIFSTFFGLTSIDKIATKCCSMTEGDNENNLLTIWEGILSLLSALESPIIVITAVVYASQLLQDRSSLKTYDFAIYIVIIITYGSALLGLAISILCTLCLCAGALVLAIKNVFSS